MWQKILVPLDGSELAELALPYAQELAGAFNSELILLYVSEASEKEYLHMHQLYLEEIALPMKKTVERVSPVVISGKPAEAVVKYTRKNDIGLIVMASHGHSGIIPWAKGGIAGKVIRTTGVPLLLIKETKRRHQAKEKRRISRILFCLDGSRAGEAAIVLIKELKSRLAAEVILLEVVPEGRHVRTIGGLDYILYPEPEIETFKAEAKEYLDKVYKRLQGDRGELKVEIRLGDVSREILNLARKEKASLIAISSHGHSGMTKWVFGSTAQKIMEDSSIPVLVVRAAPGVA
jgi:nucleotide-binding universal stress UspA family protein